MITDHLLTGARGLCLLGLSLIMAGCSIGAPEYRLPAPDRSLEIVVQEFRTDLTSGAYVSRGNFGALFSQYLAGALQDRGIPAIAIPSGDQAPESALYLVEGDIIHLNPGNLALRVLVWFGAGRAKVVARVKVTNLKDQQVVYDETLRTTSWTWLSKDSIVRRCTAKLSKIFAARMRRSMTPGR